MVATALTSRKIKLDWTDTATDEAGSEIQVKVWNGAWVKIGTVGQGVRTYTDTVGINPSTQYTYRVRMFRDINSANAIYTFNGNLNDTGGGGLNLSGSAPTYADGGLAMTTATAFQSSSTSILDTDNHKIEFDIKIRNAPDGNWRKIFGYIPVGSDRSPGIWMRPSDSKVHWRYDPANTGLNSLGVTGDGGTAFTLNTWYHITGVKKDNNFKAYVDNALVADVPVSMIKTSGPSVLWFGGADVTIKNFKIYVPDVSNWHNSNTVTTPAANAVNETCQ